MHLIRRDIRGGQHPEQAPVLRGHRHGFDMPLVALHELPGVVYRHRAREDGRGIVVEVAHLRAHIAQQRRRRKAELVQHELRLVADLADAGGHVRPFAKRVAQRRIRDGGDDGVGIRVPVSGHINGFHGSSPFSQFCDMAEAHSAWPRRHAGFSAGVEIGPGSEREAPPPIRVCAILHHNRIRRNPAPLRAAWPHPRRPR